MIFPLSLYFSALFTLHAVIRTAGEERRIFQGGGVRLGSPNSDPGKIYDKYLFQKPCPLAPNIQIKNRDSGLILTAKVAKNG